MFNPSIAKRTVAVILWPLYFTSLLLFAALLSWHLLSQFSFGYPLAYPLLKVDQHIEQFAPQNRYKIDFEYVTEQHRLDLFKQISIAVQNQGKGLQSLSYKNRQGQTVQLLRPEEIKHLQDVAVLINQFYQVGFVALVCFWTWLLLSRLLNFPAPSLSKVIISFGAAGAVTTCAVLLIGAKKAFYWLHEVVFPADSSWFFYYQDSLMTTLMKAPDLFGFICILLLLAFIPILILMLWSTYKLTPGGTTC